MSRILARLDELYAIGQHRAGYSPEEDAAHELAAHWLREAGPRGVERRRRQSLRPPR